MMISQLSDACEVRVPFSDPFFSRRFSSEKCPTLTVASFLYYFFFFRETTDLIAYVPLFTETDKTTQTTQAKSGQCKLSAKGPPFHF